MFCFQAMEKIKLLRITTVPISLTTLLKGQPEFFIQHGFDVLTASAPGAEVTQLNSVGIKHEAIPLTRKITPIADLLALIKLIRLIKNFRPHIVHTHTPKAGLIGMLAAKVCGVKTRLHTVAGLPLMEAKGLKKNLLKITERVTYACATKVYPNSIGLMTFIQSAFNIKQSKFKVIGKGSSNGIDSSYFSCAAVAQKEIDALRQTYAIGNDEFIFCFVGRLVKDKGLRELVDAFNRLSDGNGRLLLVGHREQELDPLPPETIQQMESNPKILEVGFQRDVRPWLAISHALVFPSYREGFPNVVMQAACMELPCIVTNINGCNEIIQHGESGLIIPVKDTYALTQAMKSLMSLSDQGKRFGQHARQYVSQNFSQPAVWAELLKEYLSFAQ